MFKVSWSGVYPHLCKGKWSISKDGIDVSSVIPVALRDKPMNTFGRFSIWKWADSDFLKEEWETLIDGKEVDEWIKANCWVKVICFSHDEEVSLFKAIQKVDWRHYSCGGCI